MWPQDAVATDRDVPGAWELLDLTQADTRPQALALVQAITPKEGLGARFYNIEWKLGPDPDWSRIRAYVCIDNGTPVAFAPFYRQGRPLMFRLGEVALGSVALHRLTIIGDVHFAPGVTEAQRHAAARELLALVTASLQGDEAIFFEGLPIGGVMHAVLSGSSRAVDGVVKVQMGAAYEHQYIAFPETYKEYIQGLGSRSKQSVQYSVRRLEKDMAGSVAMRKFVSPEDSRQFLEDAAAISRKTYQANLLGLGIHADADSLARLRHTAERGWLRSYILYCNDAPAAFILGFQYGGCYYYEDVGYDPAFAKWSVGTVLQVKAIEEIFGAPGKPAYFDFSTGVGQHKRRFGNVERPEVNLLVFRRTLRNRFVTSAYKATDGTSEMITRLLDRLGVKDRLKKFIRRWKNQD
jgi:hypothetical protein